MDIAIDYHREDLEEQELARLLRRYHADEILNRRSSWGDESEVIMRRGSDIGRRFFCYPYLDRGMKQSRTLIEMEEKQGAAFVNGGVVVAQQMGESRGRFGRPWHAPAGGAWFTLILSPAFLPENRQFYSLILGIACCEAIREYGVEASIKWANDIHLRGQKLAGMLIEGYTSKILEQEYLLLGIGVNVNNTSFPDSLRPQAISLREATGMKIFLPDFLARLLAKIGWYIGLMTHFEQRYLEDIYEPVKPVNPLIEQWKRYNDTLGKRVLYGFNVYEKPLFEAVAMGIDETGALILQQEPEGEVVRELSGEVIYLN